MNIIDSEDQSIRLFSVSVINYHLSSNRKHVNNSNMQIKLYFLHLRAD